MTKWMPSSHAVSSQLGPGPDAADPFGGDVDDVAWRGVVEGRELHAGADIDLGEALEQLGGAALDEAGRAADEQVVAHADRVGPLGLDGERDPRVARDVRDLAAAHEVAGDDVVAVETDPDHAGLRAAVGVDGGEVREAAGGEGAADVIGDGLARAHAESLS